MDLNTRILRLRELFRGRFSQGEAERLINHHGGDLQATVVFVFNSEAAVIRDIARTDNEGFQEVRRNQAWRELALQGIIQNEERQYACRPCDNVWWRKVPQRKMVSKCRRCHERYEAIPRNREWGWAEFICAECTHVFRGYGQMENTWSPCYQCRVPCLPNKIFPRRRRRRRRQGNSGGLFVDTHSCQADNCFQRAAGEVRGYCVHPRSLPPRGRAIVPSLRHNSTGSTVSTFLSQADLASQISDFDPNLSDVDEGGSGED